MVEWDQPSLGREALYAICVMHPEEDSSFSNVAPNTLVRSV